jgi:hypothetical protein
MQCPIVHVCCISISVIIPLVKPVNTLINLWPNIYDVKFFHRHLSKIDFLMACTACLVCFISTVNGHSKKRENASEDVALVAGSPQNLSNLYSLDIYVFFLRIFHPVYNLVVTRDLCLFLFSKFNSFQL